MAANNKQNVSTTRGVKGGYVFRAPLNTEGAPTKATYKTWSQSIPAGFVNLGYIPEDGFTESVDIDSGTTLRDINLDTLDEATGAATETIAFGLMEMKKDALAVQYGSANVTDTGGVLEVKHDWNNLEEHYQYVFLLLLKNDRLWVKYIPDGKVTEVGEFQGNKTTAAQREVTVTYIKDANGNGCYDWIDSTETSAATPNP